MNPHAPHRRTTPHHHRYCSPNGGRVRLLGSRLDDTARGGDIDLLIELDTTADAPAELAAQISARIARALDGRKVDILLAAPNLMRRPIHDIAARQG
ncbi:MAG: hypothetical protein B7Y07_05135 [Halothiobacillus sp. 24-54-40]|nr:MAG: hypothetical protein B7Y58_11855 [Halothiobacillus sp. 35-54-62]OYZ87210.1 MAG: hypothetical protein B7Y07_05135 [Halothiobacillus sp. 24-54-40]OZA78799.1 MAG: hypothetical protein B7X64_12165 [Halothiobacillus sp. 39-53-45]